MKLLKVGAFALVLIAGNASAVAAQSRARAASDVWRVGRTPVDVRRQDDGDSDRRVGRVDDKDSDDRDSDRDSDVKKAKKSKKSHKGDQRDRINGTTGTTARTAGTIADVILGRRPR